VVGYHWTNGHRSVLSSLSGLCFLKKVKTAHYVCRAASHINARSFDPVIWSRVMNAAGARERTASPVDSDWLGVGDTARLPPRGVRFPTPKRQHCRHRRDSLGTVLSETVATVSLSAPLGPVQWAISAFQDSRNDLDLEAATSTCFGLTTIALTPTNIRHCHRMLSTRQTSEKSVQITFISSLLTWKKGERLSLIAWCRFTAVCTAWVGWEGWAGVNAGDHSTLGVYCVRPSDGRPSSICLSVVCHRY